MYFVKTIVPRAAAEGWLGLGIPMALLPSSCMLPSTFYSKSSRNLSCCFQTTVSDMENGHELVIMMLEKGGAAVCIL